LLYTENCVFCHAFGNANRAVDLVHSAILQRDVNGNLLGAILRTGRPGLGMPAFSNFTPAQIADLAAFLHSLSEQSRSSGPETKQILTGDPAMGKAYFSATCSRCHSPTGDLAGVASRFRAADLQDRFLYPNGSVVPSATVTLPDGRKIEGSVVHDDEFSISVIARDGWYHSWSRAGVRVEIHDPLAAHRALLPTYTNQDIHNLLAYLATLK